jgi:hypothetical protein
MNIDNDTVRVIFKILCNPDATFKGIKFEKIVRWSEDGKSFDVLDKNNFAELRNVLCNAAGIFDTIRRLLNYSDFKRSLIPGTDLKDRFTNPLFRKNSSYAEIMSIKSKQTRNRNWLLKNAKSSSAVKGGKPSMESTITEQDSEMVDFLLSLSNPR